MARHRLTPRDAPLHQRLLGLPWLALVLTGLVVVTSVLLLRSETYAASTTVGATDGRTAAAAAVDLTRLELRQRVEEEVELAERWRGRVRLSVERPPAPDPSAAPTLLVTATAPDPRLAALAADTAAALVVVDRSDVLTLEEAATVPTRPVGELPWWSWPAGLALLGCALVLEERQRRRQMRAGAGRILAADP